MSIIWQKKTEKRQEAYAALRLANPDRYNSIVRNTLYQNAKKRAKTEGKEFTIRKEDIPLVHVCPITGIDLHLNIGGIQGLNDSYSLDRRDSNLGYVPGNVFVMSWKANKAKGNLTLEDIERLLKYMKGE